MKIFEYLDRIILMHKLLSRRITGTPEEFAHKVGISRTRLYEIIDELRLRGAPITYSKSAKTFFYLQPFDIDVTCSMKLLSCNEEKENYGGDNKGAEVLSFWFGKVEFAIDMLSG
jgi:biotin operon repressor